MRSSSPDEKNSEIKAKESPENKESPSSIDLNLSLAPNDDQVKKILAEIGGQDN